MDWLLSPSNPFERNRMQFAECILGSNAEWAYIHVVVVVVVIDVLGLLDGLLGSLLVVRRLAYTQRRAYTAHRSSKHD